MYRVLLVDSDWATISFFETVLSKEYELQTAANGKEALGMLSHFLPDVLVVEIVLADMMGWHLVAMARKQMPHLPVIAISATESWFNAREMRIKAEPILFYAVKPLNRHEIQKTLGAAVALNSRQKGQASYIGGHAR